jgi:hypothetical protein
VCCGWGGHNGGHKKRLGIHLCSLGGLVPPHSGRSYCRSEYLNGSLPCLVGCRGDKALAQQISAVVQQHTGQLDNTGAELTECVNKTAEH